MLLLEFLGLAVIAPALIGSWIGAVVVIYEPTQAEWTYL